MEFTEQLIKQKSQSELTLVVTKKEELIHFLGGVIADVASSAALKGKNKILKSMREVPQ